MWVLCSALLDLIIAAYLKHQPGLAVDEQHPDLPLDEIGIGTENNNPIDAGTSHIALPLQQVRERNRHSRSELGLFLRLTADVLSLRRYPRRSKYEIAVKSSAALICLLLFIALISGGLFVSTVAVDSTARCKSKGCGAWFPVRHPGQSEDEIAWRRPDFKIDKEEAAAAHEARCYRGDNSADDCDGLFTKAIPYSEIPNQPCPFKDDTLCLEKAFVVETPKLSASILGINSRYRFDFQRRTTCAPLITSDEYIRYEGSAEFGPGTLPSTVVYNYGGNNRQSETLSLPHPWLLFSKGMSTYIMQ